MKIAYFLLLSISFGFSCSPKVSSNSNPGISNQDNADPIIKVNFYREICDGEGPQLCYQIKEEDQEQWNNIFEYIDGLEYEWGYLYTIQIKKEKLNYPSIDGRTFNYKLIEVIDKEFVADNSFSLNLYPSLINKEDGKYFLANEVAISFATPTIKAKFEAKIKRGNRLLCDFVAQKSNIIQLAEIND